MAGKSRLMPINGIFGYGWDELQWLLFSGSGGFCAAAAGAKMMRTMKKL
jgi:hypothetical protein